MCDIVNFIGNYCKQGHVKTKYNTKIVNIFKCLRHKIDSNMDKLAFDNIVSFTSAIKSVSAFIAEKEQTNNLMSKLRKLLTQAKGCAEPNS